MGTPLLSPAEALTRNFDVQQLTDTEISPVMRQRAHHGLMVGDIGLLLASDNVVSEIFETLPLCELPNTPAWVHAMANQRGNIIPIFDLTVLLGLPKIETKHPFYFVIGQNEDAFGVLLDRLPEKVRLESEHLLDSKPPVPPMLEPFVGDAYELDGRIWLEWEPLPFIASVTQNV